MSTTQLSNRPHPASLDALASLLAHRLGETRYDVWFGRCRMTVSEGLLTVYVPAQFHKDRISKNFMEPLREVALEVLGTMPDIQIAVSTRKAPFCLPPFRQFNKENRLLHDSQVWIVHPSSRRKDR